MNKTIKIRSYWCNLPHMHNRNYKYKLQIWHIMWKNEPRNESCTACVPPHTFWQTKFASSKLGYKALQSESVNIKETCNINLVPLWPYRASVACHVPLQTNLTHYLFGTPLLIQMWKMQIQALNWMKMHQFWDHSCINYL